MSVAGGSISSQGTHSRSPSRSRSPPPYNDRYSSSSNSRGYRYNDYSYRPRGGSNSGMSAALDDYRDMRDRERDRDRDRSMLIRDDRYRVGRDRERDDRYPPYYRDDLPPPPPPPNSSSSSHYSSSSLSRDYSKMSSSSLRRDDNKEINKDLKDESKPNTPTASEPPSYSSRYMDWRDRDRDRDRRYRDDDRRRDYDRRRDGYMRDMRYESSSPYGAPPSNYNIPFGGDSYRPDRDMPPPPSPSSAYYERDRLLDDRDFYSSSSSNRRPNINPSSSSANDYDRYRRRPNWSARDNRPERIITSNNDIRSGRNSPVSQLSTPLTAKVEEEAPAPVSATTSAEQRPSRVNSLEPVIVTATVTEGLETGEVVDEKPAVEPTQPSPTFEKPMEIDEPIVEKIEPVVEEIPIKKEEPPTAVEQGEVVEEDAPMSSMTQEQIVGRISDIENQISQNEELLELALKREQEEKEKADMEEDEEDDEAVLQNNKEEAKKQALQAMDEENDEPMLDFTSKRPPQLLINQLRLKNDDEEDKLYEKILADNRIVAKQNSKEIGLSNDNWSDEEEWNKPMYAKLEDYPCYKENVENFAKLRISVAQSLGTQKQALDKKSRFLKKEYKTLYGKWKEKNIALDRIRDQERRGPERNSSHRTSSRRLQEQNQPEEYTDGIIFTSNTIDALRFNNGGTCTPYGNGLYTSDAARSEAELLEIIQSLESAEMRNPESRAKKTTATIPAMILDVRERMRTFDDRSGLVQDPLTYYHTGPDTGDHWNQEEVTTFMESYMMYPKQFERISIAIGTKTACQCVLFYYRKKKKIDFKALMKKGRRGKTNKHRDRIAAAIRLATGAESSSSGRKTKSKGSALMQDIGEAQNSRKAKEKDAAERKTRELRDLEQANAYWDGVNDRKKGKRPAYNQSLSNNTVMTEDIPTPSNTSEVTTPQRRPMLTQQQPRRYNKGRSSPRGVNEAAIVQPSLSTITMETNLVLPGGATKRATTTAPMVEESTPTSTEEETVNTVAKWSDNEKEKAVEGFKYHGRDFVQVSNLVQTKTEEQCRNFYHNFKRKNGPNAFNEEDIRPDLKAEEQDAADALVGMFQMGDRSRTPSTEMVQQPVVVVTPPVVNTQRRRRVRSTSSKTDSVNEEEWNATPMDVEYNKPLMTTARKLGTKTTPPPPPTLLASNPTVLSQSVLNNDAVKRPAYSSYWSVSEKNDFQRYLSIYGRDWEKLSQAMKTKTVIQVRNFYANNEEKMQLKDVVDRHQQQQFDTPSHFQQLQNFPFPSPIKKKEEVVYNANAPTRSFAPIVSQPPKSGKVSLTSLMEPTTTTVTKVADLLNNDDPAEPNQNSWETWFGS